MTENVFTLLIHPLTYLRVRGMRSKTNPQLVKGKKGHVRARSKMWQNVNRWSLYYGCNRKLEITSIFFFFEDSKIQPRGPQFPLPGSGTLRGACSSDAVWNRPGWQTRAAGEAPASGSPHPFLCSLPSLCPSVSGRVTSSCPSLIHRPVLGAVPHRDSPSP